MEPLIYQNYVKILQSELVPALGCTEPIAIAYAAAKARAVLACFPEKIEIRCSGNIIKNVMGVTVPNSGGLKGVAAAATLGVVGGDADSELEVLANVTQADIDRTAALVKENFCTCELEENVENLYIIAKVFAGEHTAEVTIINRHTFITRIVKDGAIVFEQAMGDTKKVGEIDKSQLNVKDILAFADTVCIDDVKEVLDRQIEMNTAIAAEGLSKKYGTQVGSTLLEVYGNDVKIRARAKAAAGSDARMSGCSLPVVINSGSGNQGMTVSLPVIEFAKELKVSQEKLYRALVISNLISIHQKRYIGSLSAFCGAVTAAAGAGAAITYLHGGDYNAICLTIVNTIANVGGIVCDGAKPSCAAKIASSVDAAILAHYLSSKNCTFQDGEGFVQGDIEATIRSMGYIGRVGMKITDTEILNIMIDQTTV
ncbi:MAG: L-serine ammonia-lyase, iron-sulfur-dependent, subunit alpha [Ruthenibacterium sp.]